MHSFEVWLEVSVFINIHTLCITAAKALVRRLNQSLHYLPIKNSEYDQEMPQSHTADKPVVL